MNLAMFSEMQGAAGVVVNAPTSDKTIRELYDTIDIPIVATMVNAEGVREKLNTVRKFSTLQPAVKRLRSWQR